MFWILSLHMNQLNPLLLSVVWWSVVDSSYLLVFIGRFLLVTNWYPGRWEKDAAGCRNALLIHLGSMLLLTGSCWKVCSIWITVFEKKMRKTGRWRWSQHATETLLVKSNWGNCNQMVCVTSHFSQLSKWKGTSLSFLLAYLWTILNYLFWYQYCFFHK